MLRRPALCSGAVRGGARSLARRGASQVSAHLSQLVLGRLNRGMSNREHLPGFDSLSTDPYIVFVLLVPVLSHIRDPRDSSTTVLSAKDCSSRIQMEGTVDSQNSL